MTSISRGLLGLTLALLLAQSFPHLDVADAQVVERATLEGVLTVQWGDPRPGSSDTTRQLVTLFDDAGAETELAFEAGSLESVGGLLAINGRRVRVTGERLPSPAALNEALSTFRVLRVAIDETSPLALGADEPAPIVGAQPWVTVLCRFGDMPATPSPQSHYQAMMRADAAPGLDHYWREASYNLVHIAGSVVTQWYNLPQPRSYYVYDRTGDGLEDLDFTRTSVDCAAVADPDVVFTNFVGINFVFNADLDCCAWGGSRSMLLDGTTKVWRTTWMPPWSHVPAVFAHEMGHGFGLPHSSGPYNTPYDSSWDPMSNTWNNPPDDPTFGEVPVHTIAYHKDKLAWIPADRKLVVAPGTTHTVTLDRLGTPSAAGSYHIVQIPIAGSATNFYTVEARRFVGYDARVPQEAVVIHKVLTTRGDRQAQVVDQDQNGNPNDAAARWLPGESYGDAPSGIAVTVDSATPTGFVVTVRQGALFTLDRRAQPFGAAGGSSTVTFSALAAGLQWTAFTTDPWITLTGPLSGVGSGAVSFSVGPSAVIRRGFIGIGGFTFMVVQTPVPFHSMRDFDGDARADVFWRHRTSGQNVLWEMDGLGVVPVPLPSVPDTNWDVKGGGDFNGDNATDVLWRNRTTGENAVWLMRAGSLAIADFLPRVPDLNLDVVGVGDFDGDRKSDIFWRNRTTGENIIWLMNGLTIGAGSYIPLVSDLDWEVKGVFDFNGDGRDDIFWRHKGTGNNAIWLMNGFTLLSGGLISAVADLNWEIQGIADVNGDLRGDVVWRHWVTGQNAIWLLNGLTLAAGGLITPLADLNWEIKGVADFNGDGKADILWRTRTGTQNAVWIMNGFTLVAANFIAPMDSQMEVQVP
jgi:FG-GAP repeat